MGLLEVQWTPDRKQLRGFGLICVIVCVALGLYVRFTHAVVWVDVEPDTASTLSVVFWVVAALCGVLATAAPTMLRPLYLVLTVIGLPVGFVVGHVVMALVFFGMFTPIALVFRLMGRDALERKLDRSAASYWAPRRPPAGPARYFRQF
jgi:Saxitoxin biosynthesis operon protein SxtJ